MITGVHVALIGEDVQKGYEFLRKLGIANYDAGGGYLIFEPSAVEMAYEASGPAPATVSFVCDDIEATIAELESRGLSCAKPVREEVWGRVSDVQLPNGQAAVLYERKYGKGKPVG